MLYHIIQKELSGCGLACMASITGKTYSEIALVAHFILDRDCKKKGTTTHHLHFILKEFGYQTPKRLIVLRGKKLTDLKVDAILKVPNPYHYGGNWHWCVWDAKRKIMLDPDYNADAWMRPTSYLPVTLKRKKK